MNKGKPTLFSIRLYYLNVEVYIYFVPRVSSHQSFIDHIQNLILIVPKYIFRYLENS